MLTIKIMPNMEYANKSVCVSDSPNTSFQSKKKKIIPNVHEFPKAWQILLNSAL